MHKVYKKEKTIKKKIITGGKNPSYPPGSRVESLVHKMSKKGNNIKMLTLK